MIAPGTAKNSGREGEKILGVHVNEMIDYVVYIVFHIGNLHFRSRDQFFSMVIKGLRTDMERHGTSLSSAWKPGVNHISPLHSYCDALKKSIKKVDSASPWTANRPFPPS